MMLKSKSTTNIQTQTDSSYRKYRTLCTSMIEQNENCRIIETRALQTTFHNVIDVNIKINTPESGLFLKKSNFTKK